MTGYDETLATCGGCKKEMLVCHYGFHPAFSVLCPDCTAKVPKLVESVRSQNK